MLFVTYTKHYEFLRDTNEEEQAVAEHYKKKSSSHYTTVSVGFYTPGGRQQSLLTGLASRLSSESTDSLRIFSFLLSTCLIVYQISSFQTPPKKTI
jgi:hypothetical protein